MSWHTNLAHPTKQFYMIHSVEPNSTQPNYTKLDEKTHYN